MKTQHSQKEKESKSYQKKKKKKWHAQGAELQGIHS